MYSKSIVIAILSIFIVAVMYSSISVDLYALKVKSVKLFEKNSADRITTDTCCQLEQTVQLKRPLNIVLNVKQHLRGKIWTLLILKRMLV